MGKTKIKTFEEEIKEPVKQEVSTEEKVTEEVKSAKAKKEKVSKRAAKKAVSQPKSRGKKYQEARGKVELSKKYSLNDAVKLAQEVSYSTFPGTLEVHINTMAKNLRGLISLPFLAGKKLVILAFGAGAEESGADIVGTDETISSIEKGPSTSLKVNTEKDIKLSDIDVIVVTPAWMPKLAKAAKILGPRGLMPNPKSGTITEKLSKAVSDLQAGKVEYKTEKDGKVIHLPIGKVTQAPEEVAANIKTLVGTIGKTKIQKITLSPTMGPGVKVDLSSI